jgi:hypothetical protein
LNLKTVSCRKRERKTGDYVGGWWKNWSRLCPGHAQQINPIEKAWFKLKQFLRASKARTAEALDQAITEALKTITADNAAAWFHYCGYALQN